MCGLLPVDNLPALDIPDSYNFIEASWDN